MKKVISILRKINTPITSKIILLICDIVAINLASLLAMWVRFGLNMGSVPIRFFDSIIEMAPINTIGTILIFAIFHMYTTLWRYASVREIGYVLMACISSSVLNISLFFMLNHEIFRSYFVVFPLLLIGFTFVSRFTYRLFRIFYRSRLGIKESKNTMIVGGGEACSLVMKELENNLDINTNIACIIDDDPKKKGLLIHGTKIVGNRDEILKNVKKFSISEIIIAIPSANKKTITEIIEICHEASNCTLKILPGVYQLVSGDVTVSKIRKVEIEDLLGRNVVDIATEKVGRYVSGKTVIVTGAGGSIGSELCRQIAANGVRQLVMIDIYENGMYEVQQELTQKYANLDIVAIIASVRNEKRIDSIFKKYKPEIVYHAAAHKHVPLMETSPNEAVKNNVFGTYKTALAAHKYAAEKFILISTDKAVNPTNIMGATKRICEMIVQMFDEKSNTEYTAVRFGNVLGSNGSVIPIFKKQIEAGGPVTVTHPDVIRYFMTIPEAVSLVLETGAKAKGGEIFVLDMGEPIKILDLAKNMIKLSGFSLDDIEIIYTGLRPGEKLYEELLMDEEGLQSTENDLIHIGKPIEFDKIKMIEKLDYLYYAMELEYEDAKEVVADIVSTYKPKDIIPTGKKEKRVEEFLVSNEEKFVSKTFLDM